MIRKRILNPDRIRRIRGGFSYIPHRFLAGGFLASLDQKEILLYLFLVLVSDRYGLSYYSYDMICSLMQLTLDEYIEARDGFLKKDLISFDGKIFQVLDLPDRPIASVPYEDSATHSQRQEVLHQGLLNAFEFFATSMEEIVVDNMLTAVTERYGRIIRFNDAFLDFLRPFKIVPVACNIRSPQEKGKIERSIQYIRQNFWPARTFTDLMDVQNQVNQWRHTVANVRIHQTTGEKPIDRFARVVPKPLPEGLPDCRETETVLVHKDYAVIFDGNQYTAPPWTVGKYLILKADYSTVTLYHLTAHFRSWERKQRIELPSHREQVKKLQNKLWRERDIALLSSLCPEAVDYLSAIAEGRQPVKKTATILLNLKDKYGEAALICAIRKAIAHKAYGAEYIRNILQQENTPKKQHPPVKLKNEELNNIRLPEPSLAEYDTYILKRRRDHE